MRNDSNIPLKETVLVVNTNKSNLKISYNNNKQCKILNVAVIYSNKKKLRDQ